MNKTSIRCAAVVAVSVLSWPAMTLAVPPVAYAVDPPTIPAIDTPPPDPDPSPVPMTMDQRGCRVPGVAPTPPLGDPPQPSVMMNLAELHKHGFTGAGVNVAVIDTGITPNPRLDVEGKGDWIIAKDQGLYDCDAHGTLIASLIAAKPAPGDQLVGVAPNSHLRSYRQSSVVYRPSMPTSGGNPILEERANHVAGLAAAIVRAANDGNRVINISLVSCMPTTQMLDQTALGLAVRYASEVKDAVVIAAAGNVGGQSAAAGGQSDGCEQNPDFDPGRPLNKAGNPDPRNWDGVVAVSSPSWFKPYVLSVGAVDPNGAAQNNATSASNYSMYGPWVDLAAPGDNVIALGPDGSTINALPDQGGVLRPIQGTSFSAAFVTGVAALIRAKYPELTAAQVRRRLTQTAHGGPRGVDNMVGYGLVDPWAALTQEMNDAGPAHDPEPHRVPVVVIPPRALPNPGPHRAAVGTAVGIGAAVIVAAAVMRRRRSNATTDLPNVLNRRGS